MQTNRPWRLTIETEETAKHSHSLEDIELQSLLGEHAAENTTIDNAVVTPPVSRFSLFMRHPKVRGVVIPAVLEAAFMLSTGYYVSRFMDSSCTWKNNPLLYPAAIIPLNAFSRFVDIDMQNQTHPIARFLKYISETARAYAFGAFMTATLLTLGHEEGHAIAADRLYYDADATIHITNSGGDTTYNADFLSALGEHFGYDYSKEIVAAAGTGFGLILNAGLLALAQVLPDNSKALKSYLRMSVVADTFNDVLYARTAAKGECEKGNDFCALRDGIFKITPADAILFMIGSMICVQLMLSLLSLAGRKTVNCIRERCNNNVTVEEVNDARDVESNRMTR